jgi:hypothetical protein
MSFGLPSGLWFAGLAAPIIFFYILKLRMRRVPVSTNMFWQQLFDEKPPRSIWQNLRHLLSLLAQLSILALLVFAVADPYLPWQEQQARRLVLVVDNSSSMGATDIKPTRLAAAIDSARQAVDGLRQSDEMAIILAGPTPEVLIGMSDHIPSLKRALYSLAVSDNPTYLSGAITLGTELLADHPRGKVLVFTDGCFDPKALSPTESPAKPENSVVEYCSFAKPAANVGITQFQARRSLVDALGYEVLIEVLNASSEKAACRLEIEMDDVPVDVLPLELEPEEKWSRSLQKTSLEGGTLVARLSRIRPPDNSDKEEKNEETTDEELNGLTSDDSAWAVLPPRTMQQVLLVTEGNLFLQKVFEANPQVQLSVVNEVPREFPPNALVVFHRLVPEKLPPGQVMVVDPAGDCDEWRLGKTLEDPIVTEQKSESPLMNHVRLDNVLMPEARQLDFRTPPEALATALSGEPVYASLDRASGKCLVLTVNLDRGDLAFRTTFPIMVANALTWYAGTAGELRPSVSTGATTAFTLDEGVPSLDDSELVLKLPSGQERTIPFQSVAAESSKATEPKPVQKADEITLGPFAEAGVWILVSRQASRDDPDREEEKALATVAVNLASPRETDLRPSELVASAAPKQAMVAGWFSRPLWFYLAAWACCALVIEWFAYQRRIIT